MNKLVMLNDVKRALYKKGYKTNTEYVRHGEGMKEMLTIKEKDWNIKLAMNVDGYIMANPSFDADQIAQIAEQSIITHKQLEASMDKDFIIENIHTAICRTGNCDENVIKQSTKFDGLDEYLCFYGIDMNGNDLMCPLKKNIFDKYDISEDDAWQAARKHNREDAVLVNLETMTGDKDAAKLPVYALTNKIKKYAAAGALDESLMRQLLGPKCTAGNRKWTVIIQSVDYAWLIPDNNDKNCEAFKVMMKYSNPGILSPAKQTGSLEYTITV